ncbi:hypothetical protein EPUS_09068 [Endocarpon pusillum Z07020]|uniref:PNPLA domain-containing protein n=1 Tax=Endocarpon pusillum (strain Z07020 / HMAS-L-300199) TaxID=1263415 RepID=U1GC36_ENDPU|nr:uncharacterized protein EPUS_09068 [Endocarpon pusillum Z07020]ERF69251.1 hypothetical protein EPUS_09068 [Endocarpon pusillum Z07020]
MPNPQKSNLAVESGCPETTPTTNPDDPPKPCDYFDMIGGTGTGGLIAVMLRRLEMTIDDCIEAYVRLADRIFKKPGQRLANWNGPVKSIFNTKALEQEFKAIVRKQTDTENTLFENEENESCKVFVCATRIENARPMQFKSYPSRTSSDLLHSARIWEVARATSATPLFFDPIKIGRFGEGFTGGRPDIDNPIQTVWNEAQHVFLREEMMLKGNLKCLVSIGTGEPSLEAFGGNLRAVGLSIGRMAIYSRIVAHSFQSAHGELVRNHQYFRFNIDQGLEDIGLEHSTRAGDIMKATRNYLQSAELSSQIQACAGRLKAGRRGRRPRSLSSPCAVSILGQSSLSAPPRKEGQTLQPPPTGSSRQPTVRLEDSRHNDVQEDIRSGIKAAFNGSPHGPFDPGRFCTASFHVSLRLEAFLDWYCEADPCRDLEAVLTLTGSAIDAQAVTCKQYMKQTWPSSGIDTLRAVKKALAQAKANSSPSPYECTLSDGSGFECSVSDSHLQVFASGMQASLVEIGEQLAWLGAALQRSPNTTKMAYTTARVVDLRSTSSQETTSAQALAISMKIHFLTDVLDEATLGLAHRGCCWHLLFHKPVIVQGYPISPRTHNEKGLEISLDLMAGLGNANYLTEFHGIPVLKGFFTMFVATVCSDDSLVWHFLCSKNEKRISYSEAVKYHPDGITGPKPENPNGEAIRHFVGWAPSVRRLAGTFDADYDHIERSRSGYCSAGCVLQNLSFTAGRYITFSGTIGPGIRNRRLITLGDRGYVEAVNYARQNIYINLYDVEERRGWLFDGASVVLHLSRTQLSHNASPLSRGLVLELQALHLATGDGGAEAAIAALTDARNMHLEIADDLLESRIEETITEGGAASRDTKKTGKRMLFHELVKRNLCLSEKMSEHQKDLTESNGIINLQGISSHKLEGWDFLDLVSRTTSLQPRFHCLMPSGRSWVNFTRCVNTINLLGRKFGPLIQPSRDAIPLCDKWKQVPLGQDFLATCVSTVDEICQKWGDKEANPFQLVQGIYWHKTHLLFERC